MKKAIQDLIQLGDKNSQLNFLLERNVAVQIIRSDSIFGQKEEIPYSFDSLILILFFNKNKNNNAQNFERFKSFEEEYSFKYRQATDTYYLVCQLDDIETITRNVIKSVYKPNSLDNLKIELLI